MKILVGLLFMLPTWVLGQIRFDQTQAWEAVLKQAKTEKKYIFVDAYTTWCGPCKAMDKAVFSGKAAGDFYNTHFISVKIQMDQTENDSPEIKSRYKDAVYLKQFVSAYPAYLFFSPDGDLVHSAIGAMSANSFIELGKGALNEKTQKVTTTRVLYEKWKTGTITGPELYELYKLCYKQKSLRDSLATSFIAYLDRAPEAELLKKENLFFFQLSAEYLTSKHQIFRVASKKMTVVDEAAGKNGYSKKLLEGVIIKEEIINKIHQNEKVLSAPNWNKLAASITQKYQLTNVDEIILRQKVKYFAKINDWKSYVEHWDQVLHKFPGDVTSGTYVFYNYNSPAWSVFKHATDTLSLQVALRWSEESITLNNNIQFLDTRANLLYKLDRKNEAIAQEKKVIERSIREKSDMQFLKEYQQTLAKMERGDPTW